MSLSYHTQTRLAERIQAYMLKSAIANPAKIDEDGNVYYSYTKESKLIMYCVIIGLGTLTGLMNYDVFVNGNISLGQSLFWPATWNFIYALWAAYSVSHILNLKVYIRDDSIVKVGAFKKVKSVPFDEVIYIDSGMESISVVTKVGTVRVPIYVFGVKSLITKIAEKVPERKIRSAAKLIESSFGIKINNI